MGTNHRHIAMSPEELPRQRLFRLLDLPQPPADFTVLDTTALTALAPREPGVAASFIVQAEWAWSPMHSRISNWEIGLDETGQHWLLWVCHHTDDCELAEWCDPDGDEEDHQYVAIWVSDLVAACPRAGLSERDAALLLLLHAWIDERDSDMELDRPHFYGAVGVLDINAIRSLECEVWPPGQR